MIIFFPGRLIPRPGGLPRKHPPPLTPSARFAALDRAFRLIGSETVLLTLRHMSFAQKSGKKSEEMRGPGVEGLGRGLTKAGQRFTPSFPCPGGGIGRRKGLKIPRSQGRAGSTPAPGTIHFFCISPGIDKSLASFNSCLDNSGVLEVVNTGG
jgi:hypothetical protein